MVMARPMATKKVCHRKLRHTGEGQYPEKVAVDSGSGPE
jgi:hypothetical protein